MRPAMSPARFSFLTAIAIALLPLQVVSAPAAELVMFERAGCVWCSRLNAEIAPIYPNTDASRSAPLRRIDVDRPLPTDLVGIDAGPFTPTFVVVDKGREVGRIRGYPGDAFFFGLLDRILLNTGLRAGPS